MRDDASDKRIKDPWQDVLRTCDVAQMLGVTESWLLTRRKKGLLPDYLMPGCLASTKGNSIRIWSKAAVKRYVKECMPPESIVHEADEPREPTEKELQDHINQIAEDMHCDMALEEQKILRDEEDA